MSSFFSSLADKAHSAYKDSPLSAQVSQLQAKLQSGQEHPTANEAAAQGGPGAKSHTLGQLQHQFRTMQMQYSTVSPVQRVITASKGVALDFESIANDSKSQSKELYMWGQHEADDIKDVSDRLAYLNFVHGTIASTLAGKLDASRATFKELRNAENNLTPKRNLRYSLKNQIARIKADNQRGMEKRLAELEKQLAQAEEDDEALEKEVSLLKRRALAESEREKWAAIREYAEKLVLLSEASTSLVSALPTVPPTPSNPYKGAEATAATRASLQYALDNYKPNSLSHSFQPSNADLKRADSRSFGVTHATELSNVAPSTSHAETKLPITPPPTHPDLASPADPAHSASPPLNPANLNNAPAPIPVSHTSGSPAVAPAAIPVPTQQLSPASVPAPNLEKPTVAETGVPVSAGGSGPGPAQGSLQELRASKSPAVAPVSTPPTEAQAPGYGVGLGGIARPAAQSFETAEQEKARLEREERERLLNAGGSGQASATTGAPASGPGPQAGSNKFETAEDEKKRLEREERERLLASSGGQNTGAGGPSSNQGPGPDQAPTTNPPPYQEY